jgi:PAS domain S-box-containing protein
VYDFRAWGLIMPDETVQKDEQLRICRDRYQKLYSRNIAGIVITTPEGRIVNCNHACAALLGFESSFEIKAHSAWEFYFDRADREATITPTSVVESDGDILRLRHRTGKPVWVKATRTVLSRRNGQPKLIQATFIDISKEKQQRESSPDGATHPRASDGIESAASLFSTSEIPALGAVIDEIAILARTLNEAVRPDGLAYAGKDEVREIFRVIDRMKMSLAQLEILRLTPKNNAGAKPEVPLE